MPGMRHRIVVAAGVGVDVVIVRDTGDGFVPADGVAEAGVGADGFYVRCGSEFDIVAAFEDVLDGEEIISAALVIEASGMSVTIENATIAEIEFVNDVDRIVPVEEFLLDGFAFRMMADSAFAAVAFERGLLGGCGARMVVQSNLLMLNWLRHCFSPLFEIKAAFFRAEPPWGNGSKRKEKKSPALGAEKRTGRKPVPESHQSPVRRK